MNPFEDLAKLHTPVLNGCFRPHDLVEGHRQPPRLG
jgi:hypothetical protein